MSDAKDLSAMAGRAEGIQAWLSENHPQCQAEQKHAVEGTIERAYWHYGYMVAVRDMLNFLEGDQ